MTNAFYIKGEGTSSLPISNNNSRHSDPPAAERNLFTQSLYIDRTFVLCTHYSLLGTPSMQQVRAKKHFGQHFLKDDAMAERIAGALSGKGYRHVLEIGPGMGRLSEHLFRRKELDTHLVEIDRESVEYLHKKYPEKTGQIQAGDFLQMDLARFPHPFAVIGNFPYNISSQILFRVLDYKDRIPEVVGMFQKEVAERIASGPGNRDYGILSVLMQAWYDIELLFILEEEDFVPPPKVKSAVLRFAARTKDTLSCDESLFRAVVKTGFNQRRKTLRNALKSLLNGRDVPYLDMRAEALHWKQFEEITTLLLSRP